MKKTKRVRGKAGLHLKLPRAAHFLELTIGILVFAAGQNLGAVLVSADPDILPPSVPTNLILTARSASQIELAWDASTDDVGVASYQLFRNGTQIYTGTATAYVNNNLTPSTAYSYTVRATDAAGNSSAQSAPLNTSTLADTFAPTVPSNLRQTAQTVSTITVAWNASTDNVGVAGYDLFRNGTLIRTQTGTSYTDTGLAVYTGYIYHVRAFDAAGNTTGLSASLSGATAQDVTAPTVPDNLRQTGSTINTVSLAWDASTDDVGIANYRLYRNGVQIATPNGTSYTDTGLNVNSSYVYTVAAIDSRGNISAQSSPLSANSSPDTTAPSTPGNVRTTDIKDTSFTLEWNTSTDDVGVVGYKLYRDGALVASPTTTSYTDTGLLPVTQYTYTVRAVDAAGNSSNASVAYQATTAYDTTAPSAPTNLDSPTQTDTSIVLSWDAATDNVGVTGYDVYRNGVFLVTTMSTSYTDTGLSVETQYTYRVRAHDGSGNVSPQSIAYSVSTLPDLIAPSSPANLVAANPTTGQIELSWQAATDDVAVTEYKIYRNGVAVATQSGLTFTDTGLRYGTSYSYQVSALDYAENESPLSAVTALSTLPDTVAPTIALTSPGNGQAVQFNLVISANANDDLELSRVEFFVGGRKLTSIASAPFALNWNSYEVGNGTHTITAVAYDASGNSTSQAATISINNPPPPVYGDLNGDYKVNIFDLSILLARWGKAGPADFNNNGRVDIFDLSVLLARYGKQ